MPTRHARRLVLGAAAALACALAPAGARASAAIIHVYEGQSIQEAITAATDGDEIIVHPGTYDEVAIHLQGKAIWLHSSDGSQVTIIDGQASATVMSCDQAEGPDTIIEGLTITNGYSCDYGGGMYIAASPMLINCSFIDNRTDDYGGGMSISSGYSPILIDCTFTANVAGSFGGGICNMGSLTLIDCAFGGNSAYYGGAVCHLEAAGHSTITDCMFSENSAASGAAMGCIHTHMTVTGCTFINNRADYSGGAMTNSDCSPTITNCAFLGNSAGTRGGAMANGDGSWPDPTTVTNCIFIGNAAGSGGGMSNVETFNSMTSPRVTNCTFSANTADIGAGLFNGNSFSTVANCIFWGDHDDEIATDDLGTPLVIYSTVEGGWKGTGNIDADPLFVQEPDPGPDGTWGTEDDDYGDLHLSAGSPCIDAADNTAVPPDTPDLDDDGDIEEPIPLDLGWQPRFVDDPHTPDTGHGEPPVVDMGAYEFQVDTCPADFDGDGDVDTADLLYLLAAWGTPDGDVDGDGDTDTADLLALLAAWGECP